MSTNAPDRPLRVIPAPSFVIPATCRVEAQRRRKAGIQLASVREPYKTGSKANQMKKILLYILLFMTAPAFAAETGKSEESKNTSGLPIPRFATIRSGEVNMRTGPGTRYPIDWVLTNKGMPVEITAEYDVWRRVRDFEGSEGWVHKASLSGKRGLVVTTTLRDLREKDKEQSSILAHLEPGAIGELLSCAKLWCRVRFGDIKGYLPKTDFWGVYENETFN